MKNLIKFILLITMFQNLLFAEKGDFEKVSLQLQWKHQFQFAGYYMAKEKGFYKDVDLEVDIKEFDFGINPVDEVKTKRSTYGIGRSSLMIDKSNGVDIRLLSAIFQSSPSVLLSLDKPNLKTINDFIGKKVMMTSDVAQTVSLLAMGKQKGINIDDMLQIKHSFNIDDLISGKTDLIASYISNEPYTLKKKGIKYTIFDPKEFGFDFYSDILFTSENEIRNHKQRADNFNKASIKGWEYAFNNIEETVALILEKYNTQKRTKEALTYEANELKKLAFYKSNKIGNIDISKLQRIYDIYNVMGFINTNTNINIENFIFKEKEINLSLTMDESKYLKNNKMIKMCNNAEYEPIEFAIDGDTKNMRGIAIDTLNLIEKELDVKFINIPTKSWKESQQFLKEKKCDILPAAVKTSERLKYANFTNPYLKLSLAILTNKNKGFVSNLDELIDKKMSRKKGSGIIQMLEDKYPNINIVQTISTNESFQYLVDGKVDFTIATIPIISNILSQYMFDNIHIAGYTDMKYNLAIAVRDDDILLLNILNKSLENISEKQYNNIYKKWVSSVVKEKVIDYKIPWQGLLIVFILILAFLYRQYTLKELNQKLEERVKEKTKKLKDLSKTLAKKVAKEVDDNRKKDALIHEQAKLASMGEMIGNIAHQWRQPLSVISTASSGMQLKKEFGMLEDEEFNKMCEAINTNTQFLSNTIDDFTSYIKGDTKIVKFNLKNDSDGFLKIINATIKSHHIHVILDLDEHIDIKGYPNQLIQCFINIFNNSKDALDENNEQNNRYVFISQKVVDNHVIIIFKDNAGGIPKDVISKIFEPYFTTKHKAQGTGLGLHMTYNLIVNSMKGTLKVENEEFEFNKKRCKGAKFTISIPYVKD